MKQFAAVLGVFAGLMLFGIAHAEPGPQWGSDQLRAARATMAVPSVQVSVKRLVTRRQSEEDNSFVTLAADFNEVVTGKSHKLDDFALCRTLGWNEGAALVDNLSCYYDPAFRLSELSNRQQLDLMISEAIKSGTKPREMASPYWAEQELAVQMTPSDPLVAKVEGDETLWYLKDKVVVRASLKGFAFTPEEKAAVGRYFARHIDLHPQVLRAILSSGQWPQTLQIERQLLDDRSTERLTFSDFKRQPAVYPLPAGLASSLTELAKTDTAEGKAIAQILALLDGKGLPKPGYDELLTSIAATATAKQGLRSTLLFLELTQLYPGTLDSSEGLDKFRAIRPIFLTAYRSREAAQFVQASELAGNQGKGQERQDAARHLSKANELDSLQFGTFRYVTFANLVLGSGDTDKWDKAIMEGMPTIADCFWTHIAAAPWGANAYYDLGNAYFSGYRTDKAWQLWDLGRAVDPQWRSGVMRNIPSFEARLRRDAPNSF